MIYNQMKIYLIRWLVVYTYFKKHCRGERRMHDRNELWVPFGMQNLTSCVALARKWIHQL